MFFSLSLSGIVWKNMMKTVPHCHIVEAAILQACPLAGLVVPLLSLAPQCHLKCLHTAIIGTRLLQQVRNEVVSSL